MSVRKRNGVGVRTLTLGELLAHPFPRREHLLFPWLRQGESVMVWAASGCGKTMLTLTMALVVAGGGEFLGWRSERPRRVLVVDGEMHTEDLKHRLEHLMPAVEGIDPAAAAENLKLMPRQWQGAEVTFPDIATPEGQDVVLGAIREHGAELVILDNFSTLAEVADENEAAAMSPVLTFLLRLKQEGVAAILVHHSGKNGGTYRGSSKLATTFEVILGLKPDADRAPSEGASFETEWTKYRQRPNESTVPAMVSLCERDGGAGAVWVSRPSDRDAIRRLIEEAQSGKHVTAKEIAEAVGVAPSTVSKLKQAAITAGRLREGELEGYLRDAMAQRMADSPHAAF